MGARNLIDGRHRVTETQYFQLRRDNLRSRVFSDFSVIDSTKTASLAIFTEPLKNVDDQECAASQIDAGPGYGLPTRDHPRHKIEYRDQQLAPALLLPVEPMAFRIGRQPKSPSHRRLIFDNRSTADRQSES
jgi:hypothetical protein